MGLETLIGFSSVAIKQIGVSCFYKLCQFHVLGVLLGTMLIYLSDFHNLES